MNTFSNGWSDYELIDAGNGKKLERFGEIILIRPEIQAHFPPELSAKEWLQRAHFEFVEFGKNKGEWKALKRFSLSHKWQISFKNLVFNLELTQFKHVGIFPEQVTNWEFIQSHLSGTSTFLNLFAYTGAASLVARSTGAFVTHVDAMKQLVTWSKENMLSSQLDNIRWLVDDALKFAQREVKRERKYDGIIMDPPAFGLGAKGERWLLDQKLPELLDCASKILSEKGFLIVNTYSPKVDVKTLEKLAKTHFQKDKISVTELWMKSTTGKKLYYGNLLRVQR